jgi:large subunit ribosomal protein L10
MPNAKKKKQVSDLSQVINQYANFVVISYNKTTHKQLEDLRNKVRKSGTSIKVLKNSLFQKAVEKLSEQNKELSKLESQFPLKGPSAMVGFSEQWHEGLKVYYDNAKKEESLSFSFGFIDNTLYEAAGVEALAKLPSREELMTKLIGTMKSPLMKTVYAMRFNMQRLTTVLNEKAKQG